MTPVPPKKPTKVTSKGTRAKKGSGVGGGANSSSSNNNTLPNHCNLCGLFIVAGEAVQLNPCGHIFCFPCLLDHQAATKYHARLTCPKVACQKPVGQYEYARRVAQQDGTLKLVPQPKRTVRYDNTKEWTTKSKSTPPSSSSTAVVQPAATLALPHAISAAYPTVPEAASTVAAAAATMDPEELENHRMVANDASAALTDSVDKRVEGLSGESPLSPAPPTIRKPAEFTTKSIRLQDLERMPRDMRRHLAALQGKVAKVLKTPHEPGKIPAFDVVAFFRTLAPVQSSAGGRPSKDAKIIARNVCMAYNEESLRNFLACWITPEQAAVVPMPDDPALEIIYGAQDDKVVFDSTVSRLNMGVREDKLKDDEEDISSGNEWED